MSVEYDSDDFDMEQIAGVDNPEESDSDHDEGINAAIRRNIVSVVPKKYKVHTRVKVMDKKTHKRVYKIVETDSDTPRYQPKHASKRRK
jgi:hypothetical protein